MMAFLAAPERFGRQQMASSTDPVAAVEEVETLEAMAVASAVVGVAAAA